MPRVGRVVLQNYPHHVAQRGRNKQVVFAEEDDYRSFLCTLEEYKDLYDIKVFGFYLMSNHYLLLVKTPEANLGRAMRHINGVYTQRHNRMKKN